MWEWFKKSKKGCDPYFLSERRRPLLWRQQLPAEGPEVAAMGGREEGSRSPLEPTKPGLARKSVWRVIWHINWQRKKALFLGTIGCSTWPTGCRRSCPLLRAAEETSPAPLALTGWTSGAPSSRTWTTMLGVRFSKRALWGKTYCNVLWQT